MPAAVGAVGAGIGAIGGLISGNSAANAAGQMAQAQLAAAQQTRQMAMGAAAPTAQELALLNSQQGAAERGLSRQEALFSSVNPAIMEAGKQALGLLQGQSSPLLAAVQQQQKLQLNAQQAQLASQFGSGGATSSAGIEAQARLQQTQQLTNAQIQQQTLGQLLGAATQGTQAMAGANAEAVAAFNNPLQNANAIQGRQVSAITGTDFSQQAGAPYVGQAASAQNFGNFFSSVGNLGSTVLGASTLGKSLGDTLNARYGGGKS